MTQNFYAQLNDQDVVVSLTQCAYSIDVTHMIPVPELDTSLLGKRYDRQASTPTDPVFVNLPATPSVPAVWEWYIDIGPFFDRFGAAKIDVLTSADIGVQAIIKDALVRKWIDISRSDVAQAVAYIGSKVPSVTPAIQASVLAPPVAPSENLALRKLYFGA